MLHHTKDVETFATLDDAKRATCEKLSSTTFPDPMHGFIFTLQTSHVNFTTLIMSPSPGSRILPTKIPQVMGKCLRPCVELGGTNHGGPSPLATVRYKALIMIQLRIDRIFACVEWPANSAVSAGLAGERQNFLHLFMAVCKEAHCCMLTKNNIPRLP